jgi:hypothetical protein
MLGVAGVPSNPACGMTTPVLLPLLKPMKE